ncbi:MAG: hypothetical protein ABI413_11420 [Ktedonobacteraceae bacterium]
MARFIKTDGAVEEVHPAAYEFTNAELHHYISGGLTGLTLTRNEEGLFMWMDSESIGKGLPHNRIATEVLHQHRPNLTHIEIFGNVLVTDLVESGSD